MCALSFLGQASVTTLQAARRAIAVPLVPRLRAGRCALLDMAPLALLARKLGGWTPQNYSKMTHMKTESAEETLSHRAVK
jgi:hypothetical protein